MIERTPLLEAPNGYARMMSGAARFRMVLAVRRWLEEARSAVIGSLIVLAATLLTGEAADTRRSDFSVSP